MKRLAKLMKKPSPVERHRALQPIVQGNRGPPAQLAFDARNVRHEVTGLDLLRQRRPWHVFDAPGAGNRDHLRREIDQARAGAAADVVRTRPSAEASWRSGDRAAIVSSACTTSSTWT